MKKYSLEQYIGMAERFNELNFREKLLLLQSNTDILTLGSDGNWWCVKVKDKEIQEELYDREKEFEIEKEWGSNEMDILVSLLGIENTDY